VLNSLSFLTPNPPYSLHKQIVFQLSQDVFLESSLPPPHPQKFIKRDSIEEIVLEGTLKKERVYTSRDVKTDLSRTRRPPKDRKRSST
jgi:hypothetical protein